MLIIIKNRIAFLAYVLFFNWFDLDTLTSDVLNFRSFGKSVKKSLAGLWVKIVLKSKLIYKTLLWTKRGSKIYPS